MNDVNRGRLMLLAAVIVPVAACSDYYPAKVIPPEVAFDTTTAKIANNTAAQWTSEHAWRIDSAASVTIASDGAADTHTTRPADILRTGAGAIVVADGASPQLFLYGPAGEFVRKTAACQLKNVASLHAYRGDSIAVHDGDMNVAILGADAQCGRTVRVARPAAIPNEEAGDSLWGGDLLVTYPDGSFAASTYGTVAIPEKRGSTWYTVQLFRASPEGAFRDTLGTFAGGQVFWRKKQAQPLEFARRLHAATAGFDLIIGNATTFRFAHVDTTGTVTLAVMRLHTPANVSKRDHIEVAMAGQPADSDTMDLVKLRHWPDKKAAYSNLLTDADGNTWVEEYRFGISDAVASNPASTFWSVFDRDGAWLGQVEVPGRFIVRRVYDNMLYGIWVDAGGERTIRGYRLTKPDVEDEVYETVNVKRGTTDKVK